MAGRLDHWHPVYLSADLRKEPVCVTLDGRAIALFRTEWGQVGALPDECIHRRMRLSTGTVEGGELVCPYHAWRYTVSGDVTSPANPKLSVRADCFEAVEQHGAIWIRNGGAATEFPRIDTAGMRFACGLSHRVKAPMPLVLDNFVEVEHTPGTHALLGYDPARMAEITTRLEAEERSVRVINEGPQKALPKFVELFFGIRSTDTFVDDWTTFFSPVYSVYEHYWKDPGTGERRGDHLRTAVFFNPVDEDETELWTFTWTSASRFGRLGLNMVAQPLIKHLVDYEIRLDKAMIESLADKSTDLRGMKLGRFDQVLGYNRKRIAAIYEGGR